MRHIEYYSLGSADEAIGLTPMTRVVDDNGKPLVQYGGGPDVWYKAERLTKEEFDALFNQPKGRKAGGFFGVVNENGAKAKAKEMEDVKAARQPIFDRQAKKLEAMVKAGFLDDKDIDQELVGNKDKEGIKTAYNKRVKKH